MTLDLRRDQILGLVDHEKGLVERKIFSDQEIYEAELEHIFARAWNFMAHDSQIPNPGDFFQTVPAGGDAYLLSHVIHDWNEDQCLTILGHCRKAIRPDGRLLIVETVLPMGDAPHQGKVQDMVMLVVPGGQERTETEYASLLGKARFRLSRVVQTASVVSVVEALPA